MPLHVHVITGGLSLAVEGPSRAEITYADYSNGLCKISYLPLEEGEYKIIVKYDSVHVRGSPFTAHISG